MKKMLNRMILGCLLTGFSLAGWADTIYMKNGVRFDGVVTKLPVEICVWKRARVP